MMHALTLSARRIYAMVYRYVTLLIGSFPRLIESIYWPVINIFLLGYLNYYLLKSRGMAEVNFHLILGATLLLEVFLRSQLAFLLCFIEEIYSRNIGQLYASPLRASEQLIAYILIMLLRITIALTPAVILCVFVFDYHLLSLGHWLWGFIFCLLLSGVAAGIMLISFLLRFGQAAEWFGWMLGWAFIPFMGIYYPLDILPEPMRLIGMALPPTYVFEGLRQLAVTGTMDAGLLLKSLGLGIVYLVVALAIFFYTIAGARRRGNLLSLNE
jgi:ABC-2 type transport system permease protein